MSDEPKRRGRPLKAKEGEKIVVCEWPHVWTNDGKIFRGDVRRIPDDEADNLIGLGAVALKGEDDA